MNPTLVSNEKIQQLQQRVSFLRNAKLTQDTRGHSKALCFVVQPIDPTPTRKTQADSAFIQTTNTHKTQANLAPPQIDASSIANPAPKFFTKVFPQDNQTHLREVEQIYQKLKIPTAKIVDLQYLPDTNETVCTYEYITGPTLKEVLPTTTTAEYETLGYQVGSFLKKFSAVKGNPQKFQTKFDAELKVLWENVFQQKRAYNQTQTQKLPVINLHRLQKVFNQLKTFIYATEPVFVHNDINLNNVIIHNRQTYFVDTDGGDIKFRALDFRGNCWWGWTGNNVEKERAVYRGIYRGLFQDHIPPEFHRELAFTMIYEFILRVYKYRNDKSQVHYSFLRWYDILTLTHYFENYTFEWF